MKKAARCAFPYTIPIFAGFWFLGIAYGIYMNVSGFSFVYPMVMAIVIFGGSSNISGGCCPAPFSACSWCTVLRMSAS